MLRQPSHTENTIRSCPGAGWLRLAGLAQAGWVSATVRVAAPGRLGRIAVEHGYSDQSHLVRDFVAFTGRSPTKWLAEEFGNVQAKDG